MLRKIIIHDQKESYYKKKIEKTTLFKFVWSLFLLNDEIEKLCITLIPGRKFIGGKISSGGLICNEDDEVDVHSLLHWLCSGNVKKMFIHLVGNST